LAGKAGLKAGLIGLAVLLASTVITQLVPMSIGLTYAVCGINTLIFGCIGVLAGVFLSPPRTPRGGAGAGAIAGLVSALINGVIGSVITAVRLARGMGLPGVDPQQVQQLADSGMNPIVFVVPGLICGAALGCGMAALGGAIFAAVKPD
jgi:hypothetical protein